GRAVAEAVKSLSWCYMMQAEPFRADDFDTPKKFVDRLRGVVRGFSQFEPEPHHVSVSHKQVTSAMREVRMLPLAERRSIYLADRLDEQATWYATKSAKHGRQAATWFAVSLIAEGLALVIVLVQASIWERLDLVGVVAAIAVAA